MGYLTQEEIAKIVITEAEDETDQCFEKIVNRLNEFRSVGDKCLEIRFAEKYKSGKGTINLARPFSHLLDIATTIINWLNYTQLVERYKDGNHKDSIRIFPEKREEVSAFLALDTPFIDRPEDEEYFQRKYGLDPAHKKDTRNLTQTRTITPKIIAEQKIRNAFIAESLKRPISAIDQEVIDAISASTGLTSTLVEDLLQKLYPNGAVGRFMTTYFDMAFAGKKRATEFEMATVEMFNKIFKFRAKRIGQQGKTPDALIISDAGNFQAIIDNKAYAEYSIANDHRNRMIHNYINGISRYGEAGRPLAFFSYIAGGFKDTFDSQLKSLCEESGVNGSGINVINMIKLIERHLKKKFAHDEIKNIFSVNRRVALKDIESRE